MIYQFCITQECNLSCRYCFEKEKDYKSYLSKENAKEYCDFIIRDYGKKQESLIINITGGEPLIRFDLVQFIIEYLTNNIHSSNIHFEISTNAMLLTEKIISYLNKKNISLYIGFDGKKKSQNKNRKTVNHEDSYRFIYKNLKNLFEKKELYFENININMVVLPNNVKKMYKNFLFILKLSKYRDISINPVYEESWSSRYLKYFKKELRKINKIYLKVLFKKNKKFSFLLVDKQVGKIISNNKQIPSIDTCGAGKSLLSISIDGSLYPCGDMIYAMNNQNNYVIGNTKNGVNENLIKNFRCSIKYKLECCKECDFIYKCNFCPVINKRVLNDFNEIPYQVCELNKVIIVETESFIDKFYKRDRELFNYKYSI